METSSRKQSPGPYTSETMEQTLLGQLCSARRVDAKGHPRPVVLVLGAFEAPRRVKLAAQILNSRCANRAVVGHHLTW